VTIGERLIRSIMSQTRSLKASISQQLKFETYINVYDLNLLMTMLGGTFSFSGNARSQDRRKKTARVRGRGPVALKK
jgi:hypothetical protein